MLSSYPGAVGERQVAATFKLVRWHDLVSFRHPGVDVAAKHVSSAGADPPRQQPEPHEATPRTERSFWSVCGGS